MSESKVSVVIPTRNRWRLLRTTVAAALAQEGVELEVIVVDDGSTDGTREQLEAIDDPRLRVCRHDASRGVAAARNTGIEAADSAWVAFLDDDDLWAPTKLRLQLDAAAAASADFAYTGAVQVSEDWQMIRVPPVPEPERLREKLRRANAIPAGSSNVVVRTDLVRSLGGFDGRLFHVADWDLWLRLAAVGRAAAVGEILVAYVKHPRNMLSSLDRDLFKELNYIFDKHDLDPREAGARLTHWAGRNHLEAGRRREAARAYLRGARDYRSGRNMVRAVRALVWPGLTGAQPRSSVTETVRPDWLNVS